MDLVIRDPYNRREVKCNSTDLLISGQTFEYTEFFEERAQDIERILKTNGLCCSRRLWRGSP